MTTVWGDDGAECDLLSALPAVLYFAECCWASASTSDLSAGATAAAAAAAADMHGDVDEVMQGAALAFETLTAGARMEWFVRAAAVDAVPGRDARWGNLSKQVQCSLAGCCCACG
jgi:hypothetical protein